MKIKHLDPHAKLFIKIISGVNGFKYNFIIISKLLLKLIY